jgi:hypothetical protein
LTTLEDLIREGLDVEALPPGTDLILHARVPLDLGRRIAVVTDEFDVIPLPPQPTASERTDT